MNTPNDAQMAQAGIAVLDRVNLTGQEAETMVLVKQWLRGMMTPVAVEPPGKGDAAPAG